MRLRDLFIASSLIALTGPFSASADEWPDGLLPKQVFRITVSEHPRTDDTQLETREGIAIAISDTVLVTSRDIISHNSRFENNLVPNRQITVNYAETAEAGADVKSWDKFNVLPVGSDDLVALQILDAPPMAQMQLSVCDNSGGSHAIYAFKNGDLNDPMRIALERDSTQSIELSGVESFIVKSSNERVAQTDIGAPVVDENGNVIGVLSQVVAENKAVVTYTSNFLKAVPDHVKVECSDRFNSTDYAELVAAVEALQTIQAQQDEEIEALQDEVTDLKTGLNIADQKAFAAMSAINDFGDKIDIENIEKLVDQMKESKPIQPWLNQISKDLGDVNWTFRVLPDVQNQSISFNAKYNRQLSDLPFSKIMALCVTPLRQPEDLATAPGRDNIENAVFYEDRDIKLVEKGRTPAAKCKRSEHKNPDQITKSGEFTFNFDAEFDDDWNGLAYVQFYQPLDPEDEANGGLEANIVRRMVIGVSIDQEDAKAADNNMACFDFGKENQKAVIAWDDIAVFLKAAPEDRDSTLKCG